jgi:hypothetical protein
MERPFFDYNPRSRDRDSGGGQSRNPSPPQGTPRQDFPGPDGDDDDGGGGGNGNGGNGGNGDDNGDDGDNGSEDDDDDDVIVYCYCCGCPWWNCHWCHYWSPMFWYYCGYDYYYWRGYWRDSWYDAFVNFHNYYDFDSYYPSIYTAPALTIDPTSTAIEYLDQGAALFREGRYLEALQEFRLAVLADLDFAVPKFAYAQTLFALGLYGHAATAIRSGMNLLPEWLDMGGDLRLMYGEEQDFEVQRTALMVHLQIDSSDEDALLLLAYVSYFSGDLYLAEKAAEKLLSSNDGETAHLAELFLASVGKIKQNLIDNGKTDDLPADDGKTIDEILRN